MQGRDDPPELRGVIPTSFEQIFEAVKLSTEMEFLIRCSYLEIYNEEIRDLLGEDPKLKCELKEDPTKGVYVKGLTDVVVDCEQTMKRIMDRGQSNRTVGATLMNQESSRSHSIFTIVVEMNQRDQTGKDHFRAGKLNLVDLAGSERSDKTGATGDRLREGCKINLSLSALGNVISALVDGKSKYIPYRDSKLTRLLQDSLGGNTKTLMVAAISPADYNYDETLSTLRYANRAKNIKNKPKINEDPKDAMLREYKSEIERLRQLLEEQRMMTVVPYPVSVPSTDSTAPMTVESLEDGDSFSRTPVYNAAVAPRAAPIQTQIQEVDDAPPPTSSPATVIIQAEPKEVIKVVEVEKIVIEKELVPVPVEVHVEVPVEVIPREHIEQKEVWAIFISISIVKSVVKQALERMNQAILEQRKQLGEDLERTEQNLKREREERALIEQKLSMLQSKVWYFISTYPYVQID